VKPAPFAFVRPQGLQHALEALAADPGAKVLAGGQSLVPLLSMRLAAPSTLVDINGLPDLDHVRVDDAGVSVGALARHTDVLASLGVRRVQPLVSLALAHVAHPTIRNRGTTVGSLVHGDPAAEVPAVLLLLDGSVTLESVEGPRDVGASVFFLGPMQTQVRPGELAVSAAFRRPPEDSGTAFVEVARRHGDYAVCGVGAVVTGSPSSLSGARVALISVAPGPVVVDLASALDDGVLDPTAVRAAVDAAIDPETDIHASADYRRHLAHVLVERAVVEARGNLRRDAA